MPARNLLTALLLVAAASPAFAQAPRTPRTHPSTLFPLDHFWSILLEAPLAAAPAVDDRRVFVPLATGRVVAYEPGRDEPIWSWSVELAAGSALAAGDGKVFVHAAGAVHALDAATGAVRWRLPAEALASPPVHRAGWLLLALPDGAMQAVRAEDGVVMWAQPMGAPLASAPSIDGDAIAAVLVDGRIAVMDIATGRPTWEKTLGSRPGGVTLSGDRIFVATSDGHFWSIKTRDGDLDWRWPRGPRMVGAAAVDTERVYAVALDNIVRGFSRGSGHVQWTYPIPTRALSGPLVIDGLVVITRAEVGSPGLTYINARTGAAAGKTPAIEPPPDATARVQFPVALSTVLPPPAVNRPRFAVLVTAANSGDWHLHAYRQTFLTATTAPIVWGKRYDVRFRLEVRVGPVIWGNRVALVPPVPRGPQVRF